MATNGCRPRENQQASPGERHCRADRTPAKRGGSAATPATHNPALPKVRHRSAIGTSALGQALENVRSTGDLVDAIFTAGSARREGRLASRLLSTALESKCSAGRRMSTSTKGRDYRAFGKGRYVARRATIVLRYLAVTHWVMLVNWQLEGRQMEISGKRVLVTGASQGLGEAMAREFASRGATVALAARSTSAIERLADELGGHAYTVDLSDAEQVDGFIDRVESDGHLDVIVNNAGMEMTELLNEMDPVVIERIIAVNLTAPLKLCAQAIPGMIDRKSGRIVQIASIAGIMPTPAMAVYSASKAGLIAGSTSLDIELAATGVGVTTVHLGTVDTDMAERALGAEVFQPFSDRANKMGLTKQMDAAKAAKDIVDAAVKEKSDVTVPKNSLPMTGLSNTPRRLSRAMAAGLRFH
jgi:short-subunit dehydrogenase